MPVIKGGTHRFFFIMWLKRSGYGCAELCHVFLVSVQQRLKLEQMGIGFLSVLFVLNPNDSFVYM